MSDNAYELTPQQVIFTLPAFERPAPSGKIDAATVIGQGRALSALALGLGVKAKGYNVFVMGQPGTGRRTAILSALRDYTSRPADLQDFVLVNQFGSAHEPRSLTFPRGQGHGFKKAIHDFVEDIKRVVAVHAESEAFQAKKEALSAESEAEENRRLTAFEGEAQAAGFRIAQTNDGEDSTTDLIPLLNDVETSFDELKASVADGTLEETALNEKRESYYRLVDRLKVLFEEIKEGRAKLERRIVELRREMIEPIIASRLRTLTAQFDQPKTAAWLETLRDDVVQHLFLFDKARIESEAQGRRRRVPPLSRYGVNVLVDNSESDKPPVIFEHRPTLANLFGSIDQEQGDDGRLAYLRVRAGSLLKAGGGFLVTRIEDLLEEGDSWTYLKRVLQDGEVQLQQDSSTPVSGPAIKPEGFPVSLKVILIGGELSYDALYNGDPDFQKLFKVCAEFDASMPLCADSLLEYSAFLDKIVADEGLLPLTDDGLYAALERAVRLSEYRDRLSTRFSLAADLLREADWWAKREGRPQLDALAVRRALEARAFIQRLPEDSLEAMILSGEILVELKGKAIGKVNGLAVHDRGYYSYGVPVVVSARIAPGDGGVVNIEGESGLSGEILDKAVLILSGYLRSRYARSFPLSVTASICFEQSYSEIDGDSATAAQLCALLSSITSIPLRQDLALTGSVNQFGGVQPVGGISEKIEGYYSVCAKKGLTGTQGVIIPRRNVRQLLLSDEVEEAVEKGLFHIHAVDHVDQAMEILSEVPAGQESEEDVFPAGSFNEKVRSRLKSMADVVRSYET